MKARNLLFALCCGITTFSSCQEAETESLESNELYMAVIARIGDMDVSLNARYAGADVNSSMFGEGDRIGLFMQEVDTEKWICRTAAEWKFEDLGFVSLSHLLWPDKTTEYKFQAYYPYNAANSDNSNEAVLMPDLSTQEGTFEDISNYDFLVAETSQSYGENGQVSFKGSGKSFIHVSSLVHLTIKANEDLSDAELTRMAISGKNIVAPTSYSFESKQVRLETGGETDLLDVSLAHEMNNEDVSFYFILNEKQTLNQKVTLTIEYKKGNKEYVAQRDEFASNIFEGGKQQEYTLSIHERFISISGTEISQWGTGEKIDDIVIDSGEKQDE